MPQSLPMTTVLVTLLGVVFALAVVLVVEHRIGRRTQSLVRRDDPAPDSVT
jgi:hypothetical protein